MGRRLLLVVGPGLVVAAMVFASTVSAKPIDKGHFHDSGVSDVYFCEGIPFQDTNDVDVNFLFNQRGSSPFPYYKQNAHGSVTTTNLITGGTYTNVFFRTARTRRSSTTVTGRSRSPTLLPAVPATTTRTATSCSRTPAKFASPTSSTTTEPLATQATTSRSQAPSKSFGPRLATVTSPAATSARTLCSSPARRLN